MACISWAQFETSDSVEKSLIAGLKPSYSLLSNRPEWIFSVFGFAMAGAIVVALNAFSTQQELMYQLKHADVQLLIMEASVASRDLAADVLALCINLQTMPLGEYRSRDLPFLRRVVCVDSDPIKTGLQS